MQIQTPKPESITISCYENYVPPFVDSVMDGLYQSLFSSMALIRIYDSVNLVSTYVAREAGRVLALFLFRREGSKVSVCNEVFKVDAAEVTRFADYIFSRFGDVSVISFRAVENDIHRLPFPYLRFNTLEDIVLTLPACVDDYLASLGKATRRTIRGNMNRLVRTYPTFRFDVYENDQIRESDVHAIIRMNHARMAGKDKVSSYSDEDARRIYALARVCGLVGVLLLDGRVCAGAVSYRIGDNYFMSLAAHDPHYDSFRLGTLNGFLNISECILRGAKECHLLWGQHDYKYRFLGVERGLDNLAVYRSPVAMLRHADHALKMTYEGVRRHVQRRAHEAKRRDAFSWRIAVKVAAGVRSMQRFGRGGLGIRVPQLGELGKLPED